MALDYYRHASLVRVPITAAIVIAAAIRMPIAPSVIVAIRVMPRTKSEENADAVAVMFAFWFSGLSGARTEYSQGCPEH
jgi:hypothetical protein